jgi:hypothetical protein
MLGLSDLAILLLPRFVFGCSALVDIGAGVFANLVAAIVFRGFSRLRLTMRCSSSSGVVAP